MKKKFQLEVPGGADKVLLHTCCAPCSSAIIECLMQHGVTPVIYYCNPNIYPLEEYIIRKDECTRYAQSLGLEIIDADYDHDAWRCRMAGMEQEPERGGRCLRCFKMRLQETARYAHEHGFPVITTTLASSHWRMKEAFVCLLLHWPLRDGRAFNKSPKPGNGLRLALKVWNFGKRTGVKVG